MSKHNWDKKNYESIVVTTFEILRSEILAFIDRGHAFRFLAVIRETFNGLFYTIPSVAATQDGKSRGIEIEEMIEFVETLAGKVTNKRSRRWLNDRLLMDFFPCLNAAEIKGYLLHLLGMGKKNMSRRK